MKPRVNRSSFKLYKKQQWSGGHVTCHQHKTCCVFSKSVSKLLWSAFAQPTQGRRVPYEIIITNLVHSHDWVHGIFLCLNGVWSLSEPQWYSVETELLFYGQQKGNIHLGQDELKEQLGGKKSTRGSPKAGGHKKHGGQNSYLCHVCSLLFLWNDIFCDFGLSKEDRRTSPNSPVPILLLRFYPHVQVLLFSIVESVVDGV